MTASPFRRLAVIGVLAASSFALAAAAPTFGPPWISIETPPNPFDASTRGAFLVVHTYHHGEVVASGVTGSAEGIVSGARRTIPLVFDTTTRRGSYALRNQWPSEGTWMLVINTGGRAQGVTALVDISSQGDVAGVRVPTRRSSDGWDLPQQVTARDIDAALETRVSRALSTRQ
jgi:hypothetical protein